MRILWLIFLFGGTSASLVFSSRQTLTHQSSIIAETRSSSIQSPSSSKFVTSPQSYSTPSSKSSSSSSFSCAPIQEEFKYLKQKVNISLTKQEKQLIEVFPIFAEWNVYTNKKLAEQFKLYIPFIANITSSFTNVSVDTILQIMNGDSCKVPEPIKCIYDDLMELVDDIEVIKDEFEVEANKYQQIVRDFSNWTCPDIQEFFYKNFKPTTESLQEKRVQLHLIQNLIFARYSEFYGDFFNEHFKILNYKRIYAETFDVPFTEVLKFFCNEPTNSSILNCLRNLLIEISESFYNVIVEIQELIEDSKGSCSKV